MDERIERLFHALLELPADRRQAEALQLADGDESVAARALALARAHEQAEAANSSLREAPTANSLGRQFGAYRAIRLLGTGGMGAVYLAERSDGQFEHRAAIKVLAPHAGSPAFQRRLQEERQILASLAHPNIARLLDGNVSDAGEPYLVMEYVEGQPLDRYAEEHKLDEPARLRLFRKVCGAVEFAHRNLVAHLDLKPSNILVTAEGEPKLLDFGAARLVTDAGARPTLPMLTLRYASPEQLQAQPVSTLSDVYSLGVILHELLTGSSPFRNPDGWEANLRRAMEDQTVQPEPGLAGELTTILRKTLAREPERRYSSVRELAEDIERYAEGRPILARPSTLAYRARKFLRRNRIGVAAGTLIAASLAAGAVSTLWQARKAQRRFQEVRQLAHFLIHDLNRGMQQVPGTTALQRSSVARSLEYLDRLAAEAGADEALRVEMAEGYASLGDVLGNPYRANLGDRTKAQAAYERGLGVLNGLRPSLPVRRARAKLNLQLAGTRSFGGDPAELNRLREAVTELRGLDSGYDEVRLDVSRGLDFLALRNASGGGNLEPARAAECERLYDEAAREVDAILARRVNDPAALRQRAQIDFDHAILYGSTQPRRAMALERGALAWLDRLPPGEKNALDVRRLRVGILMNIGWAEGQARDYAASIAHSKEAGALLEAWSAVDPENTNVLYQTTSVYRALGIVYGYQGDGAQAVQAFARAISIHERLIGLDPKNKIYRFLRAELQLRSGNWLVKLGRAAEARAAAEAGAHGMAELAAAPGASLSHTFGACRWLAETEVREVRDGRRAAEFCRQAVERTDGKDLDAWMGLAAALDLAGDARGAVDAAEKAVALLPAPESAAPTQQRKDMEAALAGYRKKLRK